MPASYEEELRHLYGLSPRGVKLGLERMEAALARRGDPQRALRFVHVAGTNGKGSVAATVESVLRASGLRTGLYTSPHLHRFVERIRIDGTPIETTDAAERLRELREDPALHELTFFEVVTLLAFETFRDAGVDVVVLEVGLGGRLDATNVVDPLVTVITSIGLEHQAWLGDTIEAIAAEKAGIVKSGVPLIVGETGTTALSVITAKARSLGAPVRVRDHAFRLEGEGEDLAYVGAGWRFARIAQTLPGAHQRQNLATALATIEVLRATFPLSDEAVRRGLGSVVWPARLERIEGRPALLLDAAHNPDGCGALAEHVRAMPARGRTVLLFGAMADKDHGAMLAAFDGLVDARVYAVPSMTRAPDPTVFAAVRPGEVASDVAAALARARALAGPDGLVVVAGSIFVVAHVRATVLGLASDPPIGM